MKPSLRLLLPLSLFLFALPVRAQNWVEVRSPHFSVVTDAGEKRGRELALQYEQMRSVFGTLIQRPAVNLPVPVQIIAVRDNKGMRQILPWFKGKPTEAVGLFLGGEVRHFILLDLSSNRGSSTVIYGFARTLLEANYPPTQHWFDEGFAEYFSTIRTGNKQVRIGAPPETLLDVLRENKLLPVTELFGVDASILREDRSDRRLLYSAHSWLLVHYLIDRKKMSMTGEYFNLVLNQGSPIPEAFRTAFGMDPAELDRQLEAYRRSPARPLTFEAPPGLDSGGYSAAPLDQADTRTVIAELHLNSPDYKEQAVQEFEEVLATRPDHAGAHRGLGYAYMRKSQFAKAGEHFQRAAALSPDDPRVLYFSALFSSQLAQAARSDPDAVWRMKDQLTKAIAINPEFADAHSLLAAAHMMTQDVESAIASIKTAIALSPRNPAYQLSLGQYYTAAQRWDEAEAVLRRLEQRHPQLAAMARDSMQKIASQRAHPPALMVREVRPPDTSAYESPKWKRKKDAATQGAPAAEDGSTTSGSAEGAVATSAAPSDDAKDSGEPAAHDTRKIEFLRGRMLSVECDSGPAATVSIASGGKTWKMRVRDRESLILINADQFSCAWGGQEVGVNYRAGGAGDGDLVSLEIRILTQEPVTLKKK